MRLLIACFIGAILMALTGCTTCCEPTSNSKSLTIIGEDAYIKVLETDFTFWSRIDTGARTTSIHTTNMIIENEDKDKKKNVGKMITFTVDNKDGLSKTLTLPIAYVQEVKNSQGVEYRYEVELTLDYEGHVSKVKINLRDRGHMSYPLLIGRNWLKGHYLVDVSKSVQKEE
ncbi:MAG: RimK/LysX family protein [Lentisphaeria bacterium]|nr:RimK/LysX family protein [Lentisphaeria bacterium]